MKRVLKLAVIIVLLLFAVVMGAWWYYGGFNRIEVSQSFQGGETIIYEEMKGPYSQSGKVMDALYHELVEKENIRTVKGIGIYYDNPKNVPEEELRSEIGEILEGISEEKLRELKSRYLVRTLPRGKYIVVEFPFKGMPSIFTGIAKVYPAMATYMEDNNIPAQNPSHEIYDVPNNKIIYRILIPGTAGE